MRKKDIGAGTWHLDERSRKLLGQSELENMKSLCSCFFSLTCPVTYITLSVSNLVTGFSQLTTPH